MLLYATKQNWMKARAGGAGAIAYLHYHVHEPGFPFLLASQPYEEA